MQMWEYKTLFIVSPGADADSFNARMAQLGDQGWELCGVFFSEEKGQYRLFLKRPKDPTSISDGSPYR